MVLQAPCCRHVSSRFVSSKAPGVSLFFFQTPVVHQCETLHIYRLEDLCLNHFVSIISEEHLETLSNQCKNLLFLEA